ncbi:PfkB family carbohydrate kinase [Levilactobacillus brevis]|uniref:PfkB family carbohydrate kinase n=1 Tax=Levilactobacillus brevis TaxID=1580 RepID=UPI000BE9BC26|nr:PfkB family carbohydrate kinase [Levilactobacillus brevis]MCZ2119471.1 PfkB family carbohydrate kinase [Levilactobacillus brevis]MCZ2124959.1 PfkB family carbohydrate kinase [Levilactobacillus brevis]MCZ2209278.1 PfkB family carbohydrate kinase [Levilactobacillus brevis]MCZ2324739.1 PfkB family carbohydrate kinase [Levilactobacillus brevis]
MSKALVLGAAFVDVVVNVPRLPFSGGDVTGDLKSYRIGGSAFNVYGALRYMQASADLLVPVGEGAYATRVKQHLSNQGISLKLPVTGADNGWDLSLVEPDGERSFLTINGIEQCWKPQWFRQVQLADYDYIYVSGYELENLRSAKAILDGLRQRRPNAQILFDTSPRIGEIPSEILQQVLAARVMVHCNEDEIGKIMPDGRTVAEKAYRLFALTQSPVMVTLGDQGTYYVDGTATGQVPAQNVPVVNTIGAGDTHCGGIIAGLMAGLALPQAIKQANQLSAQVVGQENGSLS